MKTSAPRRTRVLLVVSVLALALAGCSSDHASPLAPKRATPAAPALQAATDTVPTVRPAERRGYVVAY
jgi:hypothetical protein